MPGELLKKKREESGQELKEIAYILKIRCDYLKAIEDGAFEKLPAAIYAKGYIKEYSKYLRINYEPIIKAYSDKTTPPVPEPASPPLKRKNQHLKYLIVPTLLIASLILYMSSSSSNVKLHTAKKHDSKPIAENTLQPAKDKQSAQLDQKTKIPSTSASAPIKKDSKTTKHGLKIQASDTTWVSVNIDNTNPREMLLQQGETVTFSAQEQFALKIGNAKGIRLFFDGKDVGSLGAEGQVISLNLPQDSSFVSQIP